MKSASKVLLAVVLAAVLGFGACGGDDPGTDGGTTGATADSETDTAPTEGEDEAGAREIVVIIDEGGFSAVTTLPAGEVSFNLQNDGTELHRLMVLKTKKATKSFDDFVAQGTIDALGTIEAKPGELAKEPLTVDLEPGHYAFACNIETAGGAIHASKGEYLPFEVTD